MARDMIRIVDIEKELKRLFDETKSEKKIKACLFTLIVYSTDNERGEYIRAITSSITKQHPCRTLSIRESKGERFTIDVSQHTNPEGDVLITSDHIDITASEGYLERVPYVVIPEIVPDLPVYIIWGTDVTKECSVLDELEKFATKIIFDAESSQSLPDYCRTILNKIGKVSYEIQDIEWTVLSGWRECLAEAFNKEEGIRFLENVRQVTITYNHSDVLAKYLEAWLGSCLNWKADVKLQESSSKVFFKGAILSLEMDGTYTFARHPDHDKIILHITREKICELPQVFPFPDYQRDFNFIRELFFFVESPHYKNTLEWILRCSSRK